MSLELKINEDIKTAMKAKAEASLRSLRAIKAEILKAKTAEGFSGSLSEDDEIKILTRMLKQRRDSLSVYQSQQRADLAAKEQEEIAVIESFMP
ncbi:MAG TPA: GatB/YqeY domain-containing protein, partial [Chitinophagales bacterium]|nr:GatB/YqeY domain-containing protein [Chitinophagales bacterium]